ncbi:MAG: Fe-S cluster assembly protein SufD, partial [Flavobacteriaceae bacterium]|nr:Fe-S cluster assembly protein SufD [Flavobacteriaceae bacterium]
PRHTDANKPIQILHFSTGNKENLFLQPRNLIVLEENAQAEIIERHQCLGNAEVFTNSVTEIFVGQRAHLDYYKIQNDRSNASLIDNTYIKQESQSNCSLHTFSFGGNITRNNLQFIQAGVSAESMLNGITIIGEKQHIDHNTLVHHQFENCNSHQDYKGIFADRSTGVFNGRVLVDREAQKINAYQQNNNILIDDNATINSKPQLEIFADDVKCSHGCTIGQLDEEAMFYMQSRGIPKTEAKALLMYAFAGSVLKTVKIPEIKRKINKIISNKLGVHIGFEL